MAIHASDLAPWAQRQILQKIAAQEAQKSAAEEAAKKRKYGNTPTERETEDGSRLRFDSKKESRRYDELMFLVRDGRISDLKLQPEFTLIEAYTTPNGERIRAMRYRADFSYVDSRTGKLVVEDVKSAGTKTRVYAMKKKMLRERFGIDITEVE